MITDKEQLWQQLPPPALSASVFALAAGRDRLWAGGVGGVASCSLAEVQEVQSLWQPGIAALPLSAVTALLALDEVLLAGGSEGVAYSFDGGQSWRQAELEDGLAAIMALAASPNFASDRTALAATLENGLLRTNDGGRTWVNASFGLESLEVSALSWASASTLLAATSDGIYRSRDAGRAWRRIYIDESDAGMAVAALTTLPNGTILAALESGGLLLSHDNGKHWQTSHPGLAVSALALSVTSTGALLLGTVSGLWRSDDAGASWQMVHEQAVQICAQHAAQIYAGHIEGVSVSSDDGRTWRALPCPPLHDLRVLLAAPDHLLLAGIYTGIVDATPTRGWLPLRDIIPVELTACKLLSDETLLLSSSTGLIRLSLLDGSQQTLLAGAAGHVAHIALRQGDGRGDIWVAQGDGTGLRHSSANGANWRALPTPFGILPLVALEAVADRLLAATYDPRQYQVCLWYSTDDGQTWVRSLEASTRWPLVATCAQPAAVSIGNLLFLERNAGQWQKVTVGHDGGAIRRVLGLRLADRTLLFVLTTSGIQCSEDLGATWRQENEGLPVEHIVDLALAGTTLSVLLTGGRVWQRALLSREVL